MASSSSCKSNVFGRLGSGRGQQQEKVPGRVPASARLSHVESRVKGQEHAQEHAQDDSNNQGTSQPDRVSAFSRLSSTRAVSALPALAATTEPEPEPASPAREEKEEDSNRRPRRRRSPRRRSPHRRSRSRSRSPPRRHSGRRRPSRRFSRSRSRSRSRSSDSYSSSRSRSRSRSSDSYSSSSSSSRSRSRSPVRRGLLRAQERAQRMINPAFSYWFAEDNTNGWIVQAEINTAGPPYFVTLTTMTNEHTPHMRCQMRLSLACNPGEQACITLLEVQHGIVLLVVTTSCPTVACRREFFLCHMRGVCLQQKAVHDNTCCLPPCLQEACVKSIQEYIGLPSIEFCESNMHGVPTTKAVIKF